MALTYSFYCDIEIDDGLVQSIIAEELGKHEMQLNPFLIVQYGTTLDEYTAQTIGDAFGFKPAFGTILRLDKFAPDGVAVLKMLAVIFSLIANLRITNAALLFEEEIPIFAVSQGTLQLNSSRGFWMDSRLALVKTAYETKVMPVL